MTGLENVYWYACFGAYESLRLGLETMDKKVPQEIEQRFANLSITINKTVHIMERFILDCEIVLENEFLSK